MLVVKTIKIFSQNLHDKRVPTRRKGFVLVRVGHGGKWYTNISESMYLVYPKFPLKIRQKKKLEKDSILYTHKGSIVG